MLLFQPIINMVFGNLEWQFWDYDNKCNYAVIATNKLIDPMNESGTLQKYITELCIRQEKICIIR